MTPESPLVAAALQRQAAVLGRVCADLRLAVAQPPVAPHDWHGPASRAYDGLEAQLRSRLGVAEQAVSVALDSTRRALAQSADAAGLDG